MAFQLSPGVLVTEKDLTSIVPAVATSIGAFAGAFQWGPVDQVTTVESENKLVEMFGKPNDTVFKSFFTAANFLAYGNNLQLIRSVDASVARNSSGSQLLQLANVTGVAGTVDGGSTGNSNTNVRVLFSSPQLPNGQTALGYATVVSNVLASIVVTSAGSGYNTAPTITVTNAVTTPYSNISANVNTTLSSVYIPNETVYSSQNINGNSYSYGQWASKYPGELGNTLKISTCDAAGYSAWAYKDQFDSAPTTSTYTSELGGSFDELHVIVIDEEGALSGTRGTILEKFAFMSKTPSATKSDGSSSYYKNVINNTSKYIWWMDHPVSGVVSTDITNGNVIAWGGTTANGKPFANLTAVADVSFAFGVSGDSPSDGNITTSFSEFSNDEKHDISLILAGAASTTVINSLVSLAETRRDCVVFASPLMSDVVNTTGQAAKVVVTRNALTSSSYGFMDSSWKYQYDRYNDKYRWVPMNGDVAGLAARTDYTNDPWFSPAGFNRGTIKNVVKLSYSPSKTDRDTLYKNGINPVVSFPGQGTVLFGDKTMLSKPSAFDRINVRRLFIVLEKAIATAAKFQLFEFNDGFTRAQFKNLVEPFLRDVQGRRGITDFRVVCDETNNTGEVIDRNEFVADIFIKPARSINFIQLNFIATRTGISFEETGA